MKTNEIKGHLSMLTANTMWGFMSPVSKFVFMGSTVTPFILADCRMAGATVLFWAASLFTKREKVSKRDMLLLFIASLLGIVFNQGLFTYGLGLTSPVNASIITTSTPILTMIIAAIYLKEPITGKKVGGIILGASGALLLIFSGHQTVAAQVGDMRGDALCVLAEVSFSLYLVIFKALISRYSPVTLMKWMFLFASICTLPFTLKSFADVEWSVLDMRVGLGIAFVVCGGTFLCYLLSPVGQHHLRPTVVSMYCYVQPIIASVVAVWWGMDSFTLLKVVAVALIFSGVFLVTISKSRAQLEAEQSAPLPHSPRPSKQQQA